MSLELLNTTATLATCVIVATTAIAALVQLRHLRASNQIQGQLAINALIQSQEFTSAQLAIAHLPKMLEDPRYAWAFRERPSPALPAEVLAIRRAARTVGSNLENVGNMIRNRLTDGKLFIEQFCNIVTDSWDTLEPYTRVRRASEQNDAIWEDFEYLTIRSRDWMTKYGTALAKHRRRLLPPWNELVLPAVEKPTQSS